MLILSPFQKYNHDGYVYSIGIIEHTIASGSYDDSCQVWDIRQKKRLYTVKHSSTVKIVQLFPVGSSYDLITSSGDSTVKVWSGGELVKTLAHPNCCYRFHLNSDKTMLACSYYGGVRVWSTADWKQLAELKIGPIQDVNFNSTSNKIIAAHDDGKISIIDLE